MKRLLLLFLSLLLLGGFVTACQTGGDALPDPTDTLTDTTSDTQSPVDETADEATEKATEPPPVDIPEGEPMESINTYQNPILTCQSKDAWSSYGFGDPFVMRYNGVYYLYVSTKDGNVGIKCWSSTDLVNWEYEGFCTSDPITCGAYAPEVYYYNGHFYMYTSPAGNGHYVLRSTSPTKGFEVVTDNMGMSIDGSVLIDNNGKWYFYTAGHGAIQVYDMTSPTQMRNGRAIPSVSVNGAWTEGAMVVYHDGYYYMTYTGNHVLSPSYRILYGVSDKSPLTFDRAKENNPLLISTSEDIRGIGHSSTVKGPDLDSYYIVYHSLVDTLPNRNMNIDRIVFNGKQMVIMGPTTAPQQTPSLPDVYHRFETGFSLEGWSLMGEPATGDSGFCLSADSMLVSQSHFEGDFTAEYNVTSISEGGQAGAVFAYTDTENFGVCYFSPAEQKVVIEITVEGKNTPTEVDTVRSFGEDTRFDCLQALQIERSGNDYTFYMNDRLLCIVEDSPLTGGSIGYMTKGGTASFGFIGGTDAVGGNSGADQYKTVSDMGGFIPAYENTGELPTVTLKDGQRVVEASAGDCLSYLILAAYDGEYDLSVLSRGAEGSGGKANVHVDGTLMGSCTLSAEGKTSTAILRGMTLTAGQHILSIQLREGAVRVESLTVRRAATVNPLSVEFTKDAENPLFGDGAWEIVDGALSLSGDSSFGKVLYGSPNWGDYTVEVTVTPKSSPNCGLLVRVTNPGAPTFLNAWPSREDAAAGTDWVMGYFIGLTPNGVIIGKQSYSYTEVARVDGAFKSGETYQLKAVCEGARIRVYVDGELYLDYTDPKPFMQGMAGIRCCNSPATFDDFVVRATAP